MANEVDILNAGLARMAAYATSLPIAWPNIEGFTPPASGLWIEIRHFPNETRNLGMDDAALSEYIGSFAISVYFRPGVGLIIPAQEAESIIAHFAKGTTLGPVRVSKRPSVAPAITGDLYGWIPITVEYRGIA